LSLEGRIALVTGGSRGIGRAVVALLAREGCDIAVNYVSSDDAATGVCAEVEKVGKRALPCRANVSSSADVKAMVERIERELGTISILVNNAGIVDDGLLVRMTDESWERVISVNLTGAFNCTRAVLPGMMRQKWGRIVNVSSVVALKGNAGQANYVASKAALLGLTKATAREYASRNILVNAVCPGFIKTDMTKENEVLERVREFIPLGRAGTTEEVARAVVFLLKDATYTTGSVLDVSGGMVL